MLKLFLEGFACDFPFQQGELFNALDFPSRLSHIDFQRFYRP